MSIRVSYCLYAIPPIGMGEPFQVSNPHSQADFVWVEGALGVNFKQWCATYTGSYKSTRKYFPVPKKLSDHTFELRRFVDTNWRTREASRLETGAYSRLPPEWATLTLPKDHYCHIASGGDGADYVAYTENDEKGQRDIQTRTRAGKYIKKFFPDMSNEDVRRYATSVLPKDDLHFTDDPNVAAQLYENGPFSCMKKTTWAWAGKETIDPMPRHPTAIYFAGDLQIAWMGPVNAPTGRGLVWPERKLYGRLYGDVTRMVTALTREGYTDCSYAGNFAGARLKYIRHNEENIVMPSVDGVYDMEFVPENQTIYIGNENIKAGRKAISLRQDFRQSGITPFRHPKS